MEKFKVIPIDLYDHDICVSIGQTNEEFYNSISSNITRKKFDKHLIKNKGNNPYTWNLKKGPIIIRFPSEECFKQVHILAHEALHAACYILRAKGIFFYEETEEAYAYLMDNIIKQLIEIIQDENNNSCKPACDKS